MNERQATPLEARLLPWLQLHANALSNTANDSWTITTILGDLKVHVYEDWIACRFVGDLEPAKSHFGVHHIGGPGRLNPYSGKWNFNVWEVFTCGARSRGGKYSTITLTKLADAFIAEVQKLLPATSRSSH